MVLENGCVHGGTLLDTKGLELGKAKGHNDGTNKRLEASSEESLHFLRE